MNRFVLLTAVALLSLAPGLSAEAQPAPTEAGATETQGSALTLSIEGMSCVSCVVRITNALQGLDGVLEARVSLEEARAYVRYDAARVTVEQMVAAVQAIGYGAAVAPEG